MPGHIHPFGALGRELISRGHRVTFLHMQDTEARARAEGLEFAAVGQTDHPAGSLPVSLEQLGRLEGLAALRFTIRAVTKTTEMMCRDAPSVVRSRGIEMLLVDQMEPAGGSVAELLGLPFVTICNALALNRESTVPPPFTDWTYGTQWWRRARNLLGYAVSTRTMSPVSAVVARWRREWGLAPHKTAEASFSTLAQISQQPPAFDFPRRELPSTFHYAGPLRNPSGVTVPFPWERLDGRPLVYASLGTLQFSKEEVFRCFAAACAELGLQLVLAHCGGLSPRAVELLPGNPVAVNYAPQLEVLARARLALTHAGLNTVLDGLSCGIPLVAVPITYEQPAIAARLLYTGTGKLVGLKGLHAPQLKAAIRAVLDEPSYVRNAQVVASSIRSAGGARRAADIIETLLPPASRDARSGK